MSFKIKKWGLFGTVNAKDAMPDFSGTRAGPAGTIPGSTFLWSGRVIFCGYDSNGSLDANAVWLTYDPASGVWSGPYPAPLFCNNVWNGYNPNAGYARQLTILSDYATFYGLDNGYGAATRYFYGLNPSLEWEDFLAAVPANPGGTSGTNFLCVGRGTRQGKPAMLYYQIWGSGTSYRLYRITPDGADPIQLAGKPKWAKSWSLTWYYASPIGDYFCWSLQTTTTPPPYPYAGYSIFATPPTTDDYLSGIILPAQAANPKGIIGNAYYDVTERLLPDGTRRYLASETDLASEAAMGSGWEHKCAKWGLGFPLDDHDLDGADHGVAIPASGGEQTYNSASGLCYGLAHDYQHGTSSVVLYGLDPWPPAGRARTKPRLGAEALGWVGEYAIRENLRLDSILPLPGDRTPAGGGVRPPQEKADGYVLGASELFRRQGSKITYERAIKVDLSSYPVSSPDWFWPGTEDGSYDGFWELFAGKDHTIIGRMPDPMFGLFGPTGADGMYGLGLPAENLRAAEPAATHKLTAANRIAGTNFATPIQSSLLERRRQLLASLADDRFTYCEAGMRIGQMPDWRAYGLRFNPSTKAFTTLVDFKAKGPPHLGETNWTVWSVVPIQPCRSLPKGGWLVGATLYFDPWKENDWEWTVGAREATFRNFGTGYVPSKHGYDGPFQSANAPILLSAYDEWTANRSLYGPDALLVYDEVGTFRECLNDWTLYPPDGREILVTAGPLPRIVFRVYRYGTYSDSAEGWGQYHRLEGNEEVQAPLYVCYDLEKGGKLAPGAGSFRGFVDAYRVGDLAPKPAAWRWSNVAPTLYNWQYPKTQWLPPTSSYVRAGLGGRTLTPLSPGPVSSRTGVSGVGQRG